MKVKLTEKEQKSYEKLLELEGNKTFMSNLGKYNECLEAIGKACGESKDAVDGKGKLKEIFTSDGQKRIAYWKVTGSESKIFDVAAFKLEHGGLYERYMTKTRAAKKTLVYEGRNVGC